MTNCMVEVNILKKYSIDFDKKQLRIFQLKQNGNGRLIDKIVGSNGGNTDIISQVIFINDAYINLIGTTCCIHILFGILNGS